MGLIQKKDEKDEIDGIQIIERGEGPDGDEDEMIDLVAGTSAEHIAAGTTAEEEDAIVMREMRQTQETLDSAHGRMPLTRTSCSRSRTRTTPTWTTMHPSTRRR